MYAVVWGLAMIVGGARLIFTSASEKSVRVAAVGWPEGIVTQAEFLRALEPHLSSHAQDTLRLTFQRIHEYFLDATRREARAGAKLVVWPEANAMLFQEDEAAFLDRVRQVAREEHIHTLVGLAVVHRGSAQPFENKAVLIDPSGRVALSYVKAIPVPGFEARLSRSGTKQILTDDTSYGRLAVAICFGLDFPKYIRQVGVAKADVLLVPSSDWEAIKLVHHVSAAFRAVENGVSMVRATRWGLSAAVDPLGCELAVLDPFVTPSQAMVTHVSLRGLRTFYARYGDWFGWICVVGFLALTLESLFTLAGGRH